MKRKNSMPENEEKKDVKLTVSSREDVDELNAEELKNTWLDLNEVYVFF